MLYRKLDNITKVMLSNFDNTINQTVTLEAVSMYDCREQKLLELSRNYLITGWHHLQQVALVRQAAEL